MLAASREKAMTRRFALVSALLSASISWCDESTVVRKLAQAASHLTVADIGISSIPGIHEVEIEEDKARLHVTADGNHLFAGDLYAISSDGPSLRHPQAAFGGAQA